MARLPQGADLMRDPKAAATPAVRARAVDYSPQLQGARSLQKAGASISRGLDIAAKQIEEGQDFETKKALADFRLETDREFEEQRRSMAPGGAGFEPAWSKYYKQRADKFVRSLPEGQRDKVQQSLINQHERLSGQVQTAVRNERDRFLEQGLGNTLTGLTTRVDSDPARLNESRAEGRKLIESSGLSLARKQVLLEKFRGQIDKSALQSRLDKAVTFGQLNAIDKDLAGKNDAPEWASDIDPAQKSATTGPLARTYMDQIKQSEGYYSVAKWDVKQHTVGYGTRAKYPGERITKAEAERRFTEEITKAREIVDQAAPNAPEGVKAALTSLTFNAGAKWVRQGLGQAIAAGDYAKAKQIFLRYNKALKDGKLVTWQGLADRRRREAQWFDQTEAPTASNVEIPDDYSGPYKYLSVGQRRSVRRAIANQKRQIISNLGKAIDSLESGAFEGILPQQQIEDLSQRVEETGDPLLKSKLAITIATANEVRQRYQRSPIANQNEVTAYRSQIMNAKGGASPEQLERLEKLETFARKQSTMVKDDQLTWAFRSGVTQVAQLPADLGNGPKMGERLTHVTEAARKFGGGLQYFTKLERSALGEAINKGDVSVVSIAQNMVQNWGMEHASRAIRELAKDAPEAVIAGWMVTNNVNPQAAADIDKVLRARKDPNYKKPQMALKAQDREDEAQKTLGDVFDRFPAPQRMAIIRAADLLYEARTKEPGVADAELYRKGLAELMGERSDQNGNKFGGLVSQGSGWWSGSKNNVIVPPTWRQDTVKDVLSSVTKEDLEAAGLPIPVDSNGKPVPITRAMTGTLVPSGSELGVYYVSLGDPNTPGQEKYVLESSGGTDEEGESYDPTPYKLDLNKLEQVLRKRMPSRFWSG